MQAECKGGMLHGAEVTAKLHQKSVGFCYEFRRARASSQPELYEETPKEQNAQDDQNRDYDDLD
ncbi:MAG TPA: hypothetical protein VFH01_09045 [Pyrinomonadaceae bacterium]|nr:hypothetical protein [Pyrinomonadaceae bacterium]